jgi:hypothetical protein
MAEPKTKEKVTKRTETIAAAARLAEVYYRHNIPCFVEGPPGVGKSQMWQQVADRLKIGFIDRRLSQMDPVDLIGLPRIEGDFTTWSRPDYWPVPERDGRKGIILLDELPDAGRAMQAAALQIVLDRKAGPHELPPGWYVAAAGNSVAHKSTANVLSKALANRFAWIEVEADIQCWLDYALHRDLNPYLRAFLQMRPELLFNLESGDEKSFPSPRQWERVSHLLDEDNDIVYQLIRGCVGTGPATEYVAWRKTLSLPSIEEIVRAPKKTRIPEEPSHRFALSGMLIRFATSENLKAISTYISRPEFGREFEIVTMMQATDRDPSLVETREYAEFGTRNQDLQL